MPSPGKVPLTTTDQQRSAFPLDSGMPPVDPSKPLNEQVIDALKTCFDPEIPVNIYDLGLIYEINISPEKAIHIKMTLTSPACPVAGTLPIMVQNKVQSLPGVQAVKVETIWEPPWDQSRMTEAAKVQLGLF